MDLLSVRSLVLDIVFCVLFTRRVSTDNLEAVCLFAYPSVIGQRQTLNIGRSTHFSF